LRADAGSALRGHFGTTPTSIKLRRIMDVDLELWVMRLPEGSGRNARTIAMARGMAFRAKPKESGRSGPADKGEPLCFFNNSIDPAAGRQTVRVIGV